MGLSEAGKELWRCAAPREQKALIAVAIAVLICVGFDLSDQPIYESHKAWGLLVVGLAVVWAMLPATIRCAGNSKMVWVVCGMSAILLSLVVSIIYISYLWASHSINLPKGSDRILSFPPVLAALWAAGMGWYVHFQASAKNHRTTNSFNLLMQTRTSSEFLRRSKLAAVVYPGGVDVPFEDAELITTHAYASARSDYLSAKRVGSVTEEHIEKMRRVKAADAMKYLLNYYEFMAVGISRKDLDEEILYQTLSTTVCSIFKRSKVFVEYVIDPKRGGQCLAFEHVANLVEKWNARLIDDEHVLACKNQIAAS